MNIEVLVNDVYDINGTLKSDSMFIARESPGYAHSMRNKNDLLVR